MADATVDRITSRYEQLSRQDDRGFVVHLETYLNALHAERSVRKLVCELREEAVVVAAAFTRLDCELVAELVQIRRQLVQAAPEIDSSNAPEPEDPLQHRTWMLETLAGFDRVAATDRALGFEPIPYYNSVRGGRTPGLVLTLRGRLHEAQWGVGYGRGVHPDQPLRSDLDHFDVEIDNVSGRYQVAERRFKQDGLVLPGLADERLRAFVERLHPELFVRGADESELAFMERALSRVIDEIGIGGLLRKAAGGERMNADEQRRFDQLVAFMRGEADLLHTEIVDRLRRRQRTLRARSTTKIKAVPAWVIGTAAAALVSAGVVAAAGYANHWFWHHHDRGPPAHVGTSNTSARARSSSPP